MMGPLSSEELQIRYCQNASLCININDTFNIDLTSAALEFDILECWPSVLLRCIGFFYSKNVGLEIYLPVLPRGRDCLAFPIFRYSSEFSSLGAGNFW